MLYWKGILLLSLCGLLAPGLVAGEASTPEELVRNLGADDFDVRQEAAEKLEALGEKARAALVKARGSELLEIRATVERLLNRLKAAQLLVQIVDEDGKPCPKLTVTGGLNPLGRNFDTSARIVALGRLAKAGNESLETDADGIVRLESDQPGPHNLNLSSQRMQYWNRFAWQPQNLDLRSGENRMFWILPHGATVKGRVVSAKTGEPVADAEIMVRREDGASPASVLSNWPAGQNHLPIHWGNGDAKGEFSIENVSPASLRVYARQNDYAPAVGPALIVTENRAFTLDEPIKLTPKAAAWGRLRIQLLGDDGKPAKGAKASVRLTQVQPADDDPNADAMGGAWAVWQRRFQHRQPVVLNANEEGWLETELMEPGAYRLVLQPGDPAQGQQGPNVTRIDYGEVQVKAGETVSLEGKPNTKSGSLTCRLKSDDQQNPGMQPVRVFALRLDDPDVKAWMTQPASMQPWILNMLLNNDQNAQYVHMPNQEVELRNLLPGRYALGLHSMRDNRIGWVFGVEVKADERTTVPDIDLSEPNDPKNALTPKTLSGVLLGENGRAIQGAANWTLRSRGSSSSSNTGANFQIDIRQMGASADSLTFTCSGYRPFTIDLHKPIPNPNNIVVQLVKQKYGSVAITVRGPDGKPLEDARVMPISAVRKTPSLERAVDTRPDGKAKLTGLAFGAREITVTLDGYYLPEPAKVDIEADQLKEVEVVLQAGKAIRGRVALPAGIDPKQIIIWAANAETAGYGLPQDYWRSSPVDAEGRFAFEGQAPGRLKLRAQAPGLISEEVEAVAGEAAEPVLQLAKPVNVVLDLGTGRKGNVVLLKSGTWKPLENVYTYAYGSGASLDGNGKAVVPNVAPGTYDILFTPAQVNFMAGSQTPVQLVATGVKIEGGEATFAPKVKCTFGAATLKFQVETPETGRRRLGNNQMFLIIEGAQACAYIHLSDMSGQLPQRPWFVKGTPPDGFPAGSEGQGYQACGLPAGEYRLHLRRNPYGRRLPGLPQEKPVQLKTFTLKDGETLDLGKLDLQRPENPDDEEDTDLSELVGEDESGEDKPLR